MHFWITLPCSSFKKKQPIEYPLLLTQLLVLFSLFSSFPIVLKQLPIVFSCVYQKGDCGASVQVDSCHNDNVMILQVGNSLL